MRSYPSVKAKSKSPPAVEDPALQPDVHHPEFRRERDQAGHPKRAGENRKEIKPASFSGAAFEISPNGIPAGDKNRLVFSR